MNIVVTGGGGFIGQHVVSLLRREGHQVTEIDKRYSSAMDLLYGGARAIRETEPDAVIHLAAQVSVTRSCADPEYDAGTNIMGSIAVLKECASAGVKRVVLASSGGALYADFPRRLPYTEADVVRPKSPYGLSKKIMEEYAEWYAGRSRMNILSLRLSNVYGPGQIGGVIPVFFNVLRDGYQPILRRLPNGDSPTRDYVHVADVARAFLAAVESSTFVSGVLPINIGTGVETSVEELWTQISGSVRESDYEVRLIESGEVERSALNPARARAVLGWEPREDLGRALRSLRVDYGLSPEPPPEGAHMSDKTGESVTSTTTPGAPLGGADPVSEDELTKSKTPGKPDFTQGRPPHGTPMGGGSSHTPGAGSKPSK